MQYHELNNDLLTLNGASFFLLALLPLQPNSQVLGALEDFFHPLIDQFLLFNELFRLWVFSELDGFDEAVFELLGQTMGCLHLDVRVANADEVSHQLARRLGTLRSVVLRILLNASIFQRAKSPGNSSPNIERADMITMVLDAMIPWVLGRYLLRCLSYILLLYSTHPLAAFVMMKIFSPFSRALSRSRWEHSSSFSRTALVSGPMSRNWKELR